MDLQRIIAGRNVLSAWWAHGVLIVEDSRHRTWSYAPVKRQVYEDLMRSEEPDLFFSLVIASNFNYLRERVFLASPQLSTIDPAEIPF